MRLNKICMSALLLGTAAIATPAMAQSDAAQASPSASNTQAAQAAESPASSTQAAASTQADANVQTAAGDRAMTHDMDVKAAANAHVDAAGDTSKKYVRKNRAADFAKEQSITQQLNQQASAAASPTVR